MSMVNIIALVKNMSDKDDKDTKKELYTHNPLNIQRDFSIGVAMHLLS